MAYSITWQDRNQRLFTLTLSAPISPSEIKELQAELKPTLTASEPAYCLLDLSAVDIYNIAAKGLGDLDAVLPPNLSYHLAHSRVAIVGGGAAIKVLLRLLVSIEGEVHSIKSFGSSATALDWLQAEMITPDRSS